MTDSLHSAPRCFSPYPRLAIRHLALLRPPTSHSVLEELSTFIPRSPGQERAAPCAKDVCFYELARAWNPWRVRVSCPPCLGKLGGHQEPDVVATKHRQQLLGHFLEEAGKQSEGNQKHLMHKGKARWFSHPWTSSGAHWEEPGQALPWALGRCLAWSGTQAMQLTLWGSCSLFPYLQGLFI